MRQIPADGGGEYMADSSAGVAAECAEEIKADLYKWASKHVLRGSVRGLPEWYKDKLLTAQFEPGGIATQP